MTQIENDIKLENLHLTLNVKIWNVKIWNVQIWNVKIWNVQKLTQLVIGGWFDNSENVKRFSVYHSTNWWSTL